jgi:hypothetical protein
VLVKSNVVSINHTKNLREASRFICEYLKYVIRKHIDEEGYLTYSWDGYDEDDGQFSLSLIKAYGVQMTEVSGENYIASVVFAASGGLGELLQKLDISKAIVLNIHNITGNPWVKIDNENIDKIIERSIISVKVDAAIIDVEYFKNELAALRFIGDLY